MKILLSLIYILCLFLGSYYAYRNEQKVIMWLFLSILLTPFIAFPLLVLRIRRRNRQLQKINNSEFEIRRDVQKMVDEIRTEGFEILEPVTTDVLLKKNEICYWAEIYTPWYEFRKYHKINSKDGNYLNTSFKKTNGNYLNTPFIERLRINSREVLKKIDVGNLYITNRRVLFTGGQGNRQLRYSNMVHVNGEGNLLHIHRTSGRDVFLQCYSLTPILNEIVHQLVRRFSK